MVVKGLTLDKIVEMDWWLRKALNPELNNYEIDYSSIKEIKKDAPGDPVASKNE